MEGPDSAAKGVYRSRSCSSKCPLGNWLKLRLSCKSTVERFAAGFSGLVQRGFLPHLLRRKTDYFLGEIFSCRLAALIAKYNALQVLISTLKRVKKCKGHSKEMQCK